MRRSCDKIGGVHLTSTASIRATAMAASTRSAALTNAYADLQLAIRSEPNPAVVSSNLVTRSRFPMPAGQRRRHFLDERVLRRRFFRLCLAKRDLGSSREVVWKGLPRVAARTSVDVTLIVKPRNLAV